MCGTTSPTDDNVDGAYIKFQAAVLNQLPRPHEIDATTRKGWLKNQDALKRVLAGALIPSSFGLSPPKWRSFFLKHFSRRVDFMELHIPTKPDYPCRAIVIPQGLTNNDVFDACTKAFKTWRYEDDLNTVTDVVKRPGGPYVVWVRDTVEADEDMQNKSATDIETSGINTLTLKERMMLELIYFDETGKHLDIENWTLCAGSRDSDGSVPSCYWGGDRFDVSWASVSRRFALLRSRGAVS